MNKFAKIADGLGGWLTFEQRCGRYPLFSESYFACAIGQLLQYCYPGRVLAEVKHPVLSDLKDGRGKKPRIDFAVTGDEKGKYDLVVETKWVSNSPSLPQDIIRDIIRLELVLPIYAKEAVLVLVGNVKRIRRLFQNPALVHEDLFRAPYHPPSIEGHNKNAVYFLHALSPARRELYLRAVQTFQNVEISRVIQLERSGPFPRMTTTDQYVVYIWTIIPKGKKFKSGEYATMSLEKSQ